MGKGLLLVAAGLILSGCAGSGPTGHETLAASVAPKKARLVMYRTNPLGMATQPSYTVDGKPVGQTTPNGFVVCHLDPGPHRVSIDNMPVNVNLFGGSDRKARRAPAFKAGGQRAIGQRPIPVDKRLNWAETRIHLSDASQAYSQLCRRTAAVHHAN